MEKSYVERYALAYKLLYANESCRNMLPAYDYNLPGRDAEMHRAMAMFFEKTARLLASGNFVGACKILLDLNAQSVMWRVFGF